MSDFPEFGKPFKSPPKLGGSEKADDLVSGIRNEVRIAKALLDLKSEIGRLPSTPRTLGSIEMIEDWFLSHPD